MVSIAKYVITAWLIFGWLTLAAQFGLPAHLPEGPVLPVGAVVDSGLQHSPALRAAALGLLQQQDLVASAVNLPNPQVVLQNTTGNFFTVGFQQNLDFPTVYAAQKELQVANVSLAERAQAVELEDQKYLLQVLYVELQYRYALLQWNRSQDSVLALLADQAARQFAAGEIDYLQSSYPLAASAQQRAAFDQSKGEFWGILYKLKMLAGIAQDFLPSATSRQPDPNLASLSLNFVGDNAALSYLSQSVAVNGRALHLERQRALPSLSVGIINNGERATTYPNRIYGGIGIPLWFWQYKSKIAAAKTAVTVSEARLDAKRLVLSADLAQALPQNEMLYQGLRSYETQILPNAAALKSAANRMFVAGLRSYSEYLRSLNDVANMELAYWETWKNYQLNSIYIHYLCGKL